MKLPIQYPVWLIKQILSIVGPAGLCMQIMRDENPSYVGVSLKNYILAYINNSNLKIKTSVSLYYLKFGLLSTWVEFYFLSEFPTGIFRLRFTLQELYRLLIIFQTAWRLPLREDFLNELKVMNLMRRS